MRLGDLVIDVTPLRRSRDFRFLFAARLVSLLGLGLTLVALPLQVWQITRSSWQVGLVSVVSLVPMLVGTLAGGVLADRMDRRTLILLARGSAVAVFAVLAVNAAAEVPLDVVTVEVALVLDNTGSMALKGAAPDFEGEPRPDRWPIDERLAQVAVRWGIEPGRDLAPAVPAS